MRSDIALSPEMVDAAHGQGLTALQRTAKQAAAAHRHASQVVSALHAAGVPILAGSDANAALGSPAPVAHGKALHDELALLVAAGLTPVQALRSATVLPAALFDLAVRGAVTVGLRADLLLVDGDLTSNISASPAVQGVWVNGLRVR